MSAEELRRIARPFAPGVLARAKALAAQYRLVIESDEEGGFVGSTVELPLAMGGGKTIAACAADTLEATTAAIAVMLEHGERPPSPASQGSRDQQVNIRLTADEKFRLESAANLQGFRNLSDYVRAAAMRQAE